MPVYYHPAFKPDDADEAEQEQGQETTAKVVEAPETSKPKTSKAQVKTKER